MQSCLKYLLQVIQLTYLVSVPIKTSKLDKLVIQEVILALKFTSVQVEGQMVVASKPKVTVANVIPAKEARLVVVAQFIDVSRPTVGPTVALPVKEFQACGACRNRYYVLNELNGPYCQIVKDPVYYFHGLVRSAAIGFISRTLDTLPSILVMIIAGVRASLAGFWRGSVRVTCVSDAQFATILVCSICAIVDSNVFQRSTGAQLAVHRASVLQTKLNHSSSDGAILINQVRPQRFRQVGPFPELERLVYISGRLLSVIQSYNPLAAPESSRSSKVKSGPRSAPRGVQRPLQLRVARQLLVQPVVTFRLRRSVIVSRGWSKIDQFSAHQAGQQLRAEQATAYEEKLVDSKAGK
ncbi:MAG: hypothetical protein EZS28_008640 [Streblomastix strix]|uniref:Uncharacterized protein n=1 Tax=Streblomastix strix TaxID=222440 RepID=A0A5J4WLK8_9EUKA|nr:MAG: hypothetical protein EZS28_008640 [Streblomastix strix]